MTPKGGPTLEQAPFWKIAGVHVVAKRGQRSGGARETAARGGAPTAADRDPRHTHQKVWERAGITSSNKRNREPSSLGAVLPKAVKHGLVSAGKSS